MKIIEAEKLGQEFFRYSALEGIATVKPILEDVRKNGDAAVRKYNMQFDKVDSSNFEITKKQIKQVYSQVDAASISSLKKAAANIRAFAKKQMESMKEFETENDGSVLGQKIVPLQRVGCYVPGGRYPLPSTALMCAIPAKVAGVKEVIVCSPKIQPTTIVAAHLAGADKIFNVGGVQAIGAMAYGTSSIPRVDKIVGPGNKFVTFAKKEVYGEVGIDFIAGPSEVMVIADENGNPSLIAADLLAQAEHDPNARSDLITTSRKIADEVNTELERQLSALSTKEVAKQALANGSIVLVKSLGQSVDIANKRAPEHLELQVAKPEALVGKLFNYGSLFISENCAEVFGDYCSGTNHTLPTNGAARYTGGLSVKDFVKVLTYQKMSKKGAKRLAPIAAAIAGMEGLDAHRKAAEMRQ